MPVKRLVLTLGLCLLALSALRAATPQMSIRDIRPGMVGIGHTVFNGTRVEEFKAHIIGVVENVIGARRNLILARLEGGPLANTGVIAGMSGSFGIRGIPNSGVGLAVLGGVLREYEQRYGVLTVDRS